LRERLKFPLKARCKSLCAVSPLRVREEIEVLGMAPEEECESEMFVRIRWRGRSMAVPLSQLQLIAADSGTKEAVADWHYWIGRGYKF
jgi:hypothetical protein